MIEKIKVLYALKEADLIRERELEASGSKTVLKRRLRCALLENGDHLDKILLEVLTNFFIRKKIVRIFKTIEANFRI